MIVSCIGYGYISNYLIKELAADGVICFGITDKLEQLKKKRYENTLILPRRMTPDAISKSTHLVVTAAPEKNSCPIILKYKKYIENSNIRSIVYVSSTGVYGNYNGEWVNEKSPIKGKNNPFNKKRILSENAWIKLCKKKGISLNIVRLGAIYGPGRPKIEKKLFKNILIKNNHFFSRIHVFDISRLIVKILYNSNSFNLWNIVDDQPSTRKDFITRIIKLKKVKKFNFTNYEDNEDSMSQLKKKFWESNKKVSNKKIKNSFKYSYLFPTYMSGLKFTIKDT